jgi:ParB-like chromosome segregation protein Spo0J
LGDLGTNEHSMADSTVKITCSGAVNIDLAQLIPLQGNLKQLSKQAFDKLKSSILRYGVSFPIFVWLHEGQYFVLDGHQRDLVLRKLVDEGYHCPPLPCALIQAKDRKEASEKILIASSQYGKMSEESLEEFLTENDLSFLELADELELPAIDSRYFVDPNEFAATGEDDQDRLDRKNPVLCPHCGAEFVP